MNGLFPLIASVLQAASFTLDKTLLNLRKVDFRRYILISFPLIAGFAVILWLVVQPPMPLGSLHAGIWFFIGFMILDTVVTNSLFYRALQSDYLNELELWQLSFRIPAILLTALLFADERDPLIIGLAMLSAVAVFWSHLDHARLKIRRTTAPYIMWGLIMTPIAVAVLKLVLQEVHPVSLEVLRMVPVAVIVWFMYRSAMKPIGGKSWALLFTTNALTFTAGIIALFGYREFGIIATGLMLSITPLLVYVFSLAFLGEPFKPRRFAAFVVVLIAITVAAVSG